MSVSQALAALLIVQANPLQELASDRISSVEMYHRVFEDGRLRTAAAMAARGDCPGALAYAKRKRSPATLSAIERLCRSDANAPITPAPEPALTPAAEVAAFATAPEHALFELVRHEMVVLLESGEAGSLQKAYEIAVTAKAARARVDLASPDRRP